MPTSNLDDDQNLSQTLCVSACLDLRRRERKYLLSVTIIWIASIIFIASPTDRPPEDIDVSFIDSLFRQEQIQSEILGRSGDIYRSLIPEILYRHVQDEAQLVRQEIEKIVAVTDFSSVDISDDLVFVHADGDSLTMQVIQGTTETEKARNRRLNQMLHILEDEDLASSLPATPALEFYRDYFLLFELSEEPPDKDPSIRLFFEGKHRVLEYDSPTVFAFFDNIDFADHSAFFGDVISSDVLLLKRYRNAHVHGQSYDVPLLPFELRRSWIIWFLPPGLILLVAYAGSLGRVRRALVKHLSSSSQDSRAETLSLLINADRGSLRRYLGLKRGRIFHAFRDLPAPILFLIAGSLLFTPLLNSVFDPSIALPFGGRGNAEFLAPAVYMMMLRFIVVGALGIATILWVLDPVIRLFEPIVGHIERRVRSVRRICIGRLRRRPDRDHRINHGAGDPEAGSGSECMHTDGGSGGGANLDSDRETDDDHADKP